MLHPPLPLCVFTRVGEHLFLERISKGGNLSGNEQQEGRHPRIFIIFLFQGSSSPFTNIAPKLGGHSGKGWHQAAKFGRMAPLPHPCTHQGFFMSC